MFQHRFQENNANRSKQQMLLRNLKSLTGPFPDFDTENLPENPTDLFLQWLNTAIDKHIKEPHAMTLSTVDKEGIPDARI